MKFDWEKLLGKTEHLGNKLANGAHKMAVSAMMLFIAYQLWNFNKPI